jgi:CheY-like chemotaxis protein
LAMGRARFGAPKRDCHHHPKPTPMKILAIDDNPHMHFAYECWLEPTGYPLTCVANRDQALAALNREPWDAVLLDLHLQGPADGAAGLDLIPAIRTTSPAATIIAISGGSHWTAERASASDIDHYLVKDQHAEGLLLAKLAMIAGRVQ